MKAIVPIEVIEQKILLINGKKVMLDSDLSALYGVETKMLVRAVKRNLERFPDDFITADERKVRQLEVSFWHFKMGRQKVSPVRIYGKRCA